MRWRPTRTRTSATSSTPSWWWTILDNNAGFEVAARVPASDCATTTTIPLGAVAIPHHVSIGTTVLPNANDSTPTLDRTGPVAIAWDLTPGTADVQILRLQESINLVWVDQVVITTTRAATAIDPARLLPGRSYRFEVDVLTGYPDAASGDFDTFTHDGARATYVTAMFKPV